MWHIFVGNSPKLQVHPFRTCSFRKKMFQEQRTTGSPPTTALKWSRSAHFSDIWYIYFFARRAYCAVTPKICVRPVSVRSFVRSFVHPVLDVKGHFPDFLRYSSQNGSERCPIDHFWDPKIRRFRNRKPAFLDSKKFPKGDHFWIRTCFSPLQE